LPRIFESADVVPTLPLSPGRLPRVRGIFLARFSTGCARFARVLRDDSPLHRGQLVDNLGSPARLRQAIKKSRYH